MDTDLINFDFTEEKSAIIKVLGVGGGGGNAVNHMFRQGIQEVDFIVANTDGQALLNSPVPVKVQLGHTLTEGLGAGNVPGRGRDAAIESLDSLLNVVANGTKMLFITAGMGGGTGTGAAPVIAQAVKERGILTVAIVTMPFKFEGQRRHNQAIEGITELKKHVDSLLVINNEKIREIYGNLPMPEAFAKADNVLTTAAKSIAEIITVPGYVNVDFADVKTVMENSGVAIMGSATTTDGEPAVEAVKRALNSPLLNNNNIMGAKNILLNIVSGEKEVTMDEVTEINEYVQNESGYMADLIWGNTKDLSLGEKITVTVIATGFEMDAIPEFNVLKNAAKKVVELSNTHSKKDVPFIIEGQDGSIKTIGNTNVEVLESDENDFLQDANNKFNENTDDSEIEQELFNVPETGKINFADLKVFDELESVPAYIRRKIKVEIKNYSKDSKISRYRLSEDNETNTTRIDSRNSFLHDQVD